LSLNEDLDCQGSDMNRNWAIGWQKANENSGDVCSNESNFWFGDFAFSEVEINHVADFFKK
jgi:hypothetical protein